MRISKTGFFWTDPLEIHVGEEDGSVSTISCELKFKRVVDTGANKTLEQVRESVINSTESIDVALCRAVVLEWRNFKDADGADFAWNSENFENAISWPIVAAEFTRAWYRAHSQTAKKS